MTQAQQQQQYETPWTEEEVLAYIMSNVPNWQSSEEYYPMSTPWRRVAEYKWSQGSAHTCYRDKGRSKTIIELEASVYFLKVTKKQLKLCLGGSFDGQYMPIIVAINDYGYHAFKHDGQRDDSQQCPHGSVLIHKDLL